MLRPRKILNLVHYIPGEMRSRAHISVIHVSLLSTRTCEISPTIFADIQGHLSKMFNVDVTYLEEQCTEGSYVWRCMTFRNAAWDIQTFLLHCAAILACILEWDTPHAMLTVVIPQHLDPACAPQMSDMDSANSNCNVATPVIRLNPSTAMILPRREVETPYFARICGYLFRKSFIEKREAVILMVDRRVSVFGGGEAGDAFSGLWQKILYSEHLSVKDSCFSLDGGLGYDGAIQDQKRVQVRGSETTWKQQRAVARYGYKSGSEPEKLKILDREREPKALSTYYITNVLE
ncbi:hypothetical protein BDP27DRAFT_1363078 [Rhodocollybia butyracea]|uniref:Uncharacterized protein n=1 Tax=Rhodocollybia butyracea TaxID=206335 RepID=A0A9P5U8C7_9AGAR|nr:hypothetical protein BDP27DRAFT_1363078 [Rhodocollybia butyracea]